MESNPLLPYSDSLPFVEALFAEYQRDPGAVDEEWRRLFDSLGNGALSTLLPQGRTPPAPTARAVPATADPGVAGEPVALLRGLPLFGQLSADELADIAGLAHPVQFEDGERLCCQGEPGHDLYVITEGTVRVRREGRTLTDLGPGEVVGELAVLDHGPRSADVVARGGVEALCIRGRDVEELLERRTGLARNLLRVLVRRARDSGHLQTRVDALVRGYRERGHVLATLDPLGRSTGTHPELTLEHYGLAERDLDSRFAVRWGGQEMVVPLRGLLGQLQDTYCRAIGVQYMHIDDLGVQDWLRVRMEDSQNRRAMSRDQQLRILTKLTDAEVFEAFLHRKFVGAKRFSLEGSESLIPLLELAIDDAGEHGIEEIVIGMPHRGRLNVLTHVLDKSPAQIFREFADVDPELHIGRGDVKYHMGHSSDRKTPSGSVVHLSLAFNPSHLEFVGPVVLGRTRAKQDRRGDTEGQRGLAILIHGDAAFAGQGVIQEQLNLSGLPGYTTGGTIHVLVNNQIGFTTLPEEGRSTQYATDVARMLQIPIFHVNGEHPDAVAQVIELAMDFRKTFRRDVVIDMYGYRRYGHNEGDDPTLTQPSMYRLIQDRPSVREAYVANLLKLGGVTQDEADEIVERSRERLEAELSEARNPEYRFRSAATGFGLWQPFRGGGDAQVPEVPTGVARERLVELLDRLSRVPPDFHPHKKAERFLELRQEMARGERPLDWGAAEALAFATLVTDGVRVRLSGQDAARGTFSHRHAVLHDFENGQTFTPLRHLGPDQAPFEVFNSPLTEVAVVGFEYGYSLDYPDGLVVWEAQFGDFANVAQVIVDQFITSGEDKWNRLSGLALLLPHGFEGMGPEHSSARLERFLTLAAEDNIQVVNATTPAQIFHVLRRQVVRPWRKPLVVMSPKSLLRHPAVLSSLDDLAAGTFQRVIPDDGSATPQSVRRVLLCSGKVYYDLVQARQDREIQDIAILRLEQLYPFPREPLKQALAGYPAGTPVVWVQEEPENMGAWGFLRLRLGASVEGNGIHPLSAVTRVESASPATGSAAAHKMEQERLVAEALG